MISCLDFVGPQNKAVPSFEGIQKGDWIAFKKESGYDGKRIYVVIGEKTGGVDRLLLDLGGNTVKYNTRRHVLGEMQLGWNFEIKKLDADSVKDLLAKNERILMNLGWIQDFSTQTTDQINAIIGQKVDQLSEVASSRKERSFEDLEKISERSPLFRSPSNSHLWGIVAPF